VVCSNEQGVLIINVGNGPIIIIVVVSIVTVFDSLWH
jgi:hypothetical protein